MAGVPCRLADRAFQVHIGERRPVVLSYSVAVNGMQMLRKLARLPIAPRLPF